MSKKSQKSIHSDLSKIEELFNAISSARSDDDVKKIQKMAEGIGGKGMKIKIAGLYPLQRAMLRDALLEDIDPVKIYSGKVLDTIEAESKKVGIIIEGGSVVDKRSEETVSDRKAKYNALNIVGHVPKLKARGQSSKGKGLDI